MAYRANGRDVGTLVLRGNSSEEEGALVDLQLMGQSENRERGVAIQVPWCSTLKRSWVVREVVMVSKLALPLVRTPSSNIV